MKDYCGYKYPEGYQGRDTGYLFDMDDITSIYFKGYEDNVEKDYVKKFSDYRKSNS